MEITPEILYKLFLEAKKTLTVAKHFKDVTMSCTVNVAPIILIDDKEFKVSVLISNHPDEDDETTPA